jgi:Flp pilus assembly protein TadD
MTLVLLLIVALSASLRAQSLGEGIRALDAGRLEEAEHFFAGEVSNHPDSGGAHFYLGVTRFRAGDSSAALVLLERAVSLTPSNWRAWKTIGIVTTSAGNLERAGQALGRACELAPGDEEACYFLARNLHITGQYEAARDPFEKALRAARKQMLSRIHRAVALNFSALSMPVEAESHFRKAIQSTALAAPGGEDPNVDLGAFLFRQGRTEEALGPLEKAVQEAPASSRANTELGRVLLHTGRLEAAAARLERAVAIDPGNWNAHLLLGNAFLRLGRTEDGEREMRLGQEGWARKK